jgi:predicted metalloprotease
MKKYIGIGLVIGLVVSMYVVTHENDNKNSLTVESDYLFLNDNIAKKDNLLGIEDKKEEKKTENLIWLEE